MSTSIDLKAGDILLSTAYMQLNHPQDFWMGIVCYMRFQMFSSDGSFVAAASDTTKYTHRALEVLPLRTEFVKQVSGSDVYRLKLELKCVREAANPVISVRGGGSWIFNEQYTQA